MFLFIISAHPNFWVYIISLQKEIIEDSNSYTPLGGKDFFSIHLHKSCLWKKNLNPLVFFMFCPLCSMIQSIFITSLNTELTLWSARCGATVFTSITKEWNLFCTHIWGSMIRFWIQKAMCFRKLIEAVFKTDFRCDKTAKYNRGHLPLQ